MLAARWRRGAISLIALGVALATSALLWEYLSSPKDGPYACGDCREFGGRWWEPEFAFVIVSFNLVGWLLGVGVGRSVGRAALRRLPGRRDIANPS